MKIKLNGKAGFTLVEIMIVVAIIGLLAAIAIPNFVKARNTAQAGACINNMKQIDGAIDLFALENNKTDGDTYTADNIKSYIKGNEVPVCPECLALLRPDVVWFGELVPLGAIERAQRVALLGEAAASL